MTRDERYRILEPSLIATSGGGFAAGWRELR
jgi:hypothetical protein